MTSRKHGPSSATSRPFGERAERSFFCRSCKRAHRGLWVPEGWYVVERALGGGARHLRLGLYCSLPCLEQAAGGHLAEGAVSAPGTHADLARDKGRIVERAETLLHQGMTIRAAGDALDVPTSTLRHWLREAGIRVGPDGTLTGPAPGAPTPDATRSAPTDASATEPASAPGGRRTADPRAEPPCPARLSPRCHLVLRGRRPGACPRLPCRGDRPAGGHAGGADRHRQRGHQGGSQGRRRSRHA
jgi:hypothetical protein